MSMEERVQRLVKATRWLADQSSTGYVSGEDVARAAEIPTDDAIAYHALREAERRGLLECEAWQGGMGLPATQKPSDS